MLLYYSFSVVFVPHVVVTQANRHFWKIFHFKWHNHNSQKYISTRVDRFLVFSFFNPVFLEF